MKLPISSRLLACCSFIKPGDRVADIGCDHGYLGIYLLQNMLASAVIAADINQQPLDSAVRNANKYGVADQMTFYLSDGARNIPHDFDTLVCAGMGANTMVSILEAAPWLKSENYRLILQCQSKLPMLRQYLSNQGYCISKETVLKDGRFLYTVMEVIYAPGSPLTPGGYYFSPALLENPCKAVSQYYARVIFSLNRAIRGRGEQADPMMTAALQELAELGAKPEFTWLLEENDDDCK